jgi:uncharacterized membrane protein SirB2
LDKKLLILVCYLVQSAVAVFRKRDVRRRYGFFLYSGTVCVIKMKRINIDKKDSLCNPIRRGRE